MTDGVRLLREHRSCCVVSPSASNVTSLPASLKVRTSAPSVISPPSSRVVRTTTLSPRRELVTWVDSFHVFPAQGEVTRDAALLRAGGCEREAVRAPTLCLCKAPGDEGLVARMHSSAAVHSSGRARALRAATRRLAPPSARRHRSASGGKCDQSPRRRDTCLDSFGRVDVGQARSDRRRQSPRMRSPAED
jgi:hypothetical protein